MNKEVFKRLLRRTIIVLGIYFAIGLIYCSFSLAKKVKLYETGGNNIDEKKLSITYNVNYIYEEGKLDLDSTLTYQSHQYVGGSGYIQYQPVGSVYTIRELARKTIVDSDNIAYTMLSEYVSNKGIRNYWKNLGADYFWSGNIWGSMTSHDGVIYMKELYKFVNENEDVREEILNNHFNSVARLIFLDDETIKIAHKSGWNSAAIHDTAVIFDSHPYVLAIMSLKGNLNFYPFFKKASNLIYEFHSLYWKEKSSYCYNKTFQNN